MDLVLNEWLQVAGVDSEVPLIGCKAENARANVVETAAVRAAVREVTLGRQRFGPRFGRSLTAPLERHPGLVRVRSVAGVGAIVRRQRRT